jgi:hypothetical protein
VTSALLVTVVAALFMYALVVGLLNRGTGIRE